MKKLKKNNNDSTWKVVVTYGTKKQGKWCYKKYTFVGTQYQLTKKIENHYNKPDKDYGKAEAVEVELIDGFE